MSQHRATTAVDCDICGKRISRKADLARHQKTHATNKEDLKFSCPFAGCTYKALQLSNLKTHYNIHTGERPHECPEEGCEFSCGDPGSLTRHRKELHGYAPKEDSRSPPYAGSRRAARRCRRVTPYPSSSSSSSSSASSMSPSVHPSFDAYHTPRPQLPEIIDTEPGPSGSSCHCRAKRRHKDISAAFNTHITTKRNPYFDSLAAPRSPPASRSAIPGLLLTLETTIRQPQLLSPEQYNLLSNDLPAQTGAQMISGGRSDDFLAPYDNFENHRTPLPSLRASVTHSTTPSSYVARPSPDVEDHTVTSFHPYADGYDHTTNNSSYQSCGYSYSFAPPDMGVFPRVVDQSHPHASPTGTSGLPMQGFYPY